MFSNFFSLTSIAVPVAPLLFVSSVAAQASNNDPEGETLFVAQPHCNSYQCVVEWPQCSQQLVQWLNPPENNISVQLMNRETWEAHNISTSIEPLSDCTNNTESSMDCGETNFTLGLWEPAMYSVVLTDLNNPATQGYSDLVQVTANDSCTVDPNSVSSSSASAASDSMSPSASGVSGSASAAAASSSSPGSPELDVALSSSKDNADVSSAQRLVGQLGLAGVGAVALAAFL